MGLGDWIMATAQVKELNERTGRHVVVVDRLGRPRWSEAFENNPRIVRMPAGNEARLLNAGGARPYIREKSPARWVWKKWDIQPGEIYLSPGEQAYGERYGAGAIIVEPNTKVPNGNKAWLPERWRELVARRPDLPWVQIGDATAPRLPGVRYVQTDSARHAFGMIAAARVFVGTEGALHHAAAAFGTRAVVLWSEFISPVFTGYATQRNVRKVATVCGSRLPCKGCRESMEAITVDEVDQAVIAEWEK